MYKEKIVSKFKNIIQERRLPWILEHRVETGRNRWHYYLNRWSHNKFLSTFIKTHHQSKKTIVFKCGFHGKSGAVFSISDIANTLASSFCVKFVSYPESNYNPLLHKSVKILKTPDMTADLFICDVSCDHDFFIELKNKKKKSIVSCHGMLFDLHGLDPQYVKKSLHLAQKVRFVNRLQQDIFQLEEGRYEIIPNMTKPIRKTQRTNNVGVVGNLSEKNKNVEESVKIALPSNATFIHLWGAGDTVRFNHPKIKTHPWESNKDKIFNSFDVLVFLSKQETFGRVVIESMSAGIPCLLSSIPAFEQFRDCPGVKLIDSQNKEKATHLLNELLFHKDELKESIIAFWKKYYSENEFSKQWIQLIAKI